MRAASAAIVASLCATRPPLLPRARKASATLSTREPLLERRNRLLAELADVNRAIEADASATQLLENEAAQQGEQDLPIALGSRTSAFEPSFGYLSRSAGVYTDDLSADGVNLPSSAFDLAVKNFRRELAEMLRALNGTDSCRNEDDCTPEALALREKLSALVLDNDRVWERERKREAAGGKVSAPLVLLGPYYFLCWCLDVFFDGRPLARFWFLETVARMPYFSYVSMLHLYESLGWWRRSAETKRVHFAEEWNEFHHLLTMEALGGDQRWRDRFLAQHAAIVYYWLLVGLWLLSPTLAYNFSELIEAHAVDTYGEFVDENRDALAALPAPRVSRLYWAGPDLFLFDEFQTARARGSRRVQCATLLDVFINIRDDEAEHVATMAACQDPNVVVAAPRVEAALIASVAIGAIALTVLGAPESVGEVADVAGSIDMAELGAEATVGIGALVGLFEGAAEAVADVVEFFVERLRRRPFE